ncbi:hypothetical protein GVN18_32350 [Pseudomonas sp. ODNR1LW]|nr:hypothetical protein [Pseudomonas sp. ODNR1LW]
MLTTSILLIVLGLTIFDQGPVGVALRRWLVAAPARLLSQWSRGQLIGLACVALIGAAAVVLFEAEGLRLFAMAAPEMLGWFLMFDVTVLFDLLVLTVSLHALAGWRGLGRLAQTGRDKALRLWTQVRTRARSRVRRLRRPRPPAAGSLDDEPGCAIPAWA